MIWAILSGIALCGFVVSLVVNVVFYIHNRRLEDRLSILKKRFRGGEWE
jgi:hypothetical protein